MAMVEVREQTAPEAAVLLNDLVDIFGKVNTGGDASEVNAYSDAVTVIVDERKLFYRIGEQLPLARRLLDEGMESKGATSRPDTFFELIRPGSIVKPGEGRNPYDALYRVTRTTDPMELKAIIGRTVTGMTYYNGEVGRVEVRLPRSRESDHRIHLY